MRLWRERLARWWCDVMHAPHTVWPVCDLDGRVHFICTWCHRVRLRAGGSGPVYGEEAP